MLITVDGRSYVLEKDIFGKRVAFARHSVLANGRRAENQVLERKEERTEVRKIIPAIWKRLEDLRCF